MSFRSATVAASLAVLAAAAGCESTTGVTNHSTGTVGACFYQGEVYGPGESPPCNGTCCAKCTCEESGIRGGALPTYKMSCLQVPPICGNDVIPTFTCSYRGRSYSLNQMFPAPDGCNTCTCVMKEGEPVVDCTPNDCDGGADATGDRDAETDATNDGASD